MEVVRYVQRNFNSHYVLSSYYVVSSVLSNRIIFFMAMICVCILLERNIATNMCDNNLHSQKTILYYDIPQVVISSGMT